MSAGEKRLSNLELWANHNLFYNDDIRVERVLQITIHKLNFWGCRLKYHIESLTLTIRDVINNWEYMYKYVYTIVYLNLMHVQTTS